MNDFMTDLKSRWAAKQVVEDKLIKEHGKRIFKADSKDSQFAHMTCGNYVISVELCNLNDCEGQPLSAMRLDIAKITLTLK